MELAVPEAVEAARALTADGDLEYLEQPCRTVDELARLRTLIDVSVAADESIRKSDDPLRVVAAGVREETARELCARAEKLIRSGALDQKEETKYN